MRKFVASVVTAGLLAVSAVPSFATPILRLTSGASSVTVNDNGVGDLAANAGAVTFSGSVGDFILSVTTGMTKPIIGSVNQPRLDLNSVSATSSTGGSLKLEFTETGFLTAYDVTNFLTQIGGTIANGLGNSLEFKVYADAANAAFGTATEIFSSTFDQGAFSAEAFSGVGLPTATPYSLTLVAQLTHTAGDIRVSSFDGFVGVPEPATVAILGVGLLGLGLSRRRRAEKSSQ